MRWEDERYVRLYIRDSATWAMLPWQSRCLLPLLLRRVDRAGLLEVVSGEESEAVSNLVNIPLEVVTVGLQGLEKRGVVTIRHGELRLPTFLAAQTAKQSDKLRQEKSRELAALGRQLSHAVTPSHTLSQDVTLSCAVPSCDVTSRAEEKLPREKKLRAVPKPEKTPKPTDPRHAPLVAELCEIFEENIHSKYPFTGRDAKAVADLLSIESEPERISTVWRHALRSTGYPTVRTIPELVTHWAHFCGTQPTATAKGAAWTQQGATTWTEADLAADPYEAMRGGK